MDSICIIHANAQQRQISDDEHMSASGEEVAKLGAVLSGTTLILGLILFLPILVMPLSWFPWSLNTSLILMLIGLAMMAIGSVGTVIAKRPKP